MNLNSNMKNYSYRDDLADQLKNRSMDIEVKLLMFAIQKTGDFERLLSQRFSNPESVS